jgi:hypothetical protein
MTRAGGNGQLYIGKEKNKMKTTGDYRISWTGITERTGVDRSSVGDPDHDAGLKGGGHIHPIQIGNFHHQIL